MTTIQTPKQVYIDDVLTGRTLHYLAEAHRSADRMNYVPMIAAQHFGAIVQTLGKAATQSDFLADGAAAALRAISPALNVHQNIAGIAAALLRFSNEPWIDTRKMSGPEPGRPSAWTHDVTPRQRILLAVLMSEILFVAGPTGSVPGVSSALRYLLEEYAILVYPHTFPNVARALSARGE